MNTAGRLLAIYERLLSRGRSNDAPMLKVWGQFIERTAKAADSLDKIRKAGERALRKCRAAVAGLGP